MNKRVKSLVAVTALGMATIAIYSTRGIAAPSIVPAQPLTPAKVAPPTKSNPHIFRCVKCRVFIVGRGHHRHSAWRLGLRHNKKLSATDARTITNAALLMRGQHNLDVGKIQFKTTAHGRKIYLIDIVNKKQNKVVQRVVLNSANGHIHPLSR